MDIKDCAAIVSGGASGLGFATAKHLAGRGARVTIVDVNEAAVAQAASDIGALGIACDVSDAGGVEAAAVSAAQAHGPTRILVNCAGIASAKRIVGKHGPMPLADFSRVIEVNLIGTFNLMRVAAAQMMATDPRNDTGERGVIVNTASVAAYEGQIGQAAYAASKGAIVSLTLQAAREFSRAGIRVMTIAPGLMRTPLLEGMPEQIQQSLASQVPFPTRFGEPEEFAELVEHIVGNAMLNGEVIRLDGAIRMQAS